MISCYDNDKIFTYSFGIKYAFVGEVYVNGQNEDVWCNSNIRLPSLDSPMYYDSVERHNLMSAGSETWYMFSNGLLMQPFWGIDLSYNAIFICKKY